MGVAEISAYVLVAVLVITLCAVFARPLKTILRLVVSSIFGGIGLYILNWLLAPTGFFVGVNVATAAICGMLGLPGVVLVTAVKLLFHI